MPQQMTERLWMAYWADNDCDGVFGSRPSYSSKADAWDNAIEYLEAEMTHMTVFNYHDKAASRDTKIRRMKKNGIDVGLFVCQLSPSPSSTP